MTNSPLNGHRPPRTQLQLDFAWLGWLIQARSDELGGTGGPPPDWSRHVPFVLRGDPYARFVRQYGLSAAERLVVVLALATELAPELIRGLHRQGNRDPRIGTVDGELPGEALPSIRTALFLLGGPAISAQTPFFDLFTPGQRLDALGILDIGLAGEKTARRHQVIRISRETLSLITTGQEFKPSFSMDFPAQRIHTSLEWNDLVLNASTMAQVMEIQAWLQHKKVLYEDWELGRKLKPGFRALFFGPPGTGKTMTAALLGKRTERDVYRVDLSMVVSKYIGETEKNMSKIFDLAEHKDWILFFDEADALFGKRGKVSDARDRYANQEVSFLLQRVEDFDGLIILASNLKSNMDEAFLRRFQAVIQFPFPKANERMDLWERTFSPHTRLDQSINLREVARRYELSGGSILNVVQFASLMAVQRGGNIIMKEDLMEGIQREYMKEGKVL